MNKGNAGLDNWAAPSNFMMHLVVWAGQGRVVNKNGAEQGWGQATIGYFNYGWGHRVIFLESHLGFYTLILPPHMTLTPHS